MPRTPTAHRDPRCGILDVLHCPLCNERLEFSGRALRCAQQHAYDIARHGYVSLLTGSLRAPSADAAPMVQARDAFLRSGHYAPLARTLTDLTATRCRPRGTVLDAGTGTGYYLAAVLDALPEAVGLGLDASKFALRRAARAHPRAGAAVWDIWQPFPARSGSVDVVLNVFAPRNGPEFHRVLRPDGALLVATPASRHLAELRQYIGLLAVDPVKKERLHRTLNAHFQQEHTEPLEYDVTLSTQELDNLVSMGPTARHISHDELRQGIARLDGPLQVTVSFVVSVYRPR